MAKEKEMSEEIVILQDKIENNELKGLYEISNSYERGVVNVYYNREDDSYIIAHLFYGGANIKSIIKDGNVIFSDV